MLNIPHLFHRLGQVMTGDRVLFIAAGVGNPLHASNCVIGDNDNVREVSVAVRPTGTQDIMTVSAC